MSKKAIVILLFAILISGCTDYETPELVIKEKQPDIRIASYNTEKDFGLSKGFTATSTLTLTNYGEADGTVTIDYIGDYSGSLMQKTLFVPAQDSIIDTTELDITMDDKSVRYRILNQKKV